MAERSPDRTSDFQFVYTFTRRSFHHIMQLTPMSGGYRGNQNLSSRTSESDLAYMDALVRAEFGMSYGQYCGSILIDAIRSGEKLPQPRKSRRGGAESVCRGEHEGVFAQAPKHRNRKHDRRRNQATIASRYE